MSLASELRDEGYLDFGLVSNKPHEMCDNFFLFSAVACALDDTGELNEIVRDRVWDYFHQVPLKWPIMRYPGDRGECSHDELIGLAFLFPFIALKCYNENPAARFTYLRPYFKACMDRELSWLDRLNFWTWDWITSLSEKQNTSSKQLFWLMRQKIGGGVPRRTREQYSGPREMLGIYYGNHPITRHAPETRT